MMPKSHTNPNLPSRPSPYTANAERVIGSHMAAVDGLGRLTRKLLSAGAGPLGENLSNVLSGPANARAQALGQPRFYDRTPEEQDV